MVKNTSMLTIGRLESDEHNEGPNEKISVAKVHYTAPDEMSDEESYGEADDVKVNETENVSANG